MAPSHIHNYVKLSNNLCAQASYSILWHSLARRRNPERLNMGYE